MLDHYKNNPMPDPTETYQVTKEQLREILQYVEGVTYHQNYVESVLEILGIKPIAKVDHVDGDKYAAITTPNGFTLTGLNDKHDPLFADIYNGNGSIDKDGAGLEFKGMYAAVRNFDPNTAVLTESTITPEIVEELNQIAIDTLRPPKLDLKEIERLYENKLTQEQLYVMKYTARGHKMNLKNEPQKFK